MNTLRLNAMLFLIYRVKVEINPKPSTKKVKSIQQVLGKFCLWKPKIRNDCNQPNRAEEKG